MVHKAETPPQEERSADLNAPEQTKALAQAFMCTYMYVTALYTPSQRPKSFHKGGLTELLGSARGMAT